MSEHLEGSFVLEWPFSSSAAMWHVGVNERKPCYKTGYLRFLLKAESPYGSLKIFTTNLNVNKDNCYDACFSLWLILMVSDNLNSNFA